MVVGQTSGIEFPVGDAVVAVDKGVVGGDASFESDVFVHALCLGEGESAAEAPAPANLPFVGFA